MLAPGTYTVTFRSATNGFEDALGMPLDGADNGNPAGSNYVATFVVGATSVVVGIPAFARGPDSAAAINLPNSVSDGIPLNVSVGSGITSGTFTLTYNSALLDITGASVNTSLAGATLSLDPASTPGTAILDFSCPTPLTQTGVVRLGGLAATVPNSAAAFYKSKALLHWSGVKLNGGAIAALGDDAVEVVAYFGDAAGTANGSLSAGDGSDISAVATGLGNNAAAGTLGGFAAFPLADPVIIAGLSNNGLVDATDVTLFNAVLAGIPKPQIPSIPTGLPIVATGPDPSLSLPTKLQVAPNGTVVVPVNIDTAHPDGSTGALEAVLALRYDPRIFNVSAADVQLGTLTAGWQLTTVVNSQTGEIGLDLLGSTPFQTTAGGSLVIITMQQVGSGQWAVGSNAGAALSLAPLSLVNQVDPTGKRMFTTMVADSQGAFVLQMNSGQWPAGGGQLALANSFLAADETVSSPEFTAYVPLPTARLFPSLAAHFSLPASPVEETGFEQPAELLRMELADQALTGLQGLALPVPSPMGTEIDWAADVSPANLLQAAKRSAWTSGLDWLDGRDSDSD